MNISSISSLSSHISAAAQTVEPRQSPAAQKELIQAVKAVNASGMMGEENELTFIIDRKAGIAVVRVVNKESGDVVLQIPNEQVVKMAEESNRR